MEKIFISYAKEDAALAKRIYTDLMEHGLNCWLDTEDLLPGQRWREAIGEAIQRSSYFIALLSSNSVNKRGFVQKEVYQALEILKEFPGKRIFLIPVRVDRCEPSHKELAEIHWVDLFPDYKAGLDRIISAFKHGEIQQPVAQDEGPQAVAQVEEPQVSTLDVRMPGSKDTVLPWLKVVKDQKTRFSPFRSYARFLPVIRRILVDEGDFVNAGERILELEDNEFYTSSVGHLCSPVSGVIKKWHITDSKPMKKWEKGSYIGYRQHVPNYGEALLTIELAEPCNGLTERAISRRLVRELIASGKRARIYNMLGAVAGSLIVLVVASWIILAMGASLGTGWSILLFVPLLLIVVGLAALLISIYASKFQESRQFDPAAAFAVDPACEPHKYLDPRDGSEYRTVKLRDGNIWLAENLRFEILESAPGSYPRLVESFPADPLPPEEVLETNPDYDSDKYGRLYTWEAAQLAAPPGWHVPTAGEWKRLFNAYGGWEHGIHADSSGTQEISSLVREMDMEFGGCVRASSGGAAWNRASDHGQDEALPSAFYTYFGDFMGARFWSSSRPTFLSGFMARKFSGIYFLIRPNPVGDPAPGDAPSAHRSQEVLDYAFSVRCIAD